MQLDSSCVFARARWPLFGTWLLGRAFVAAPWAEPPRCSGGGLTVGTLRVLSVLAFWPRLWPRRWCLLLGRASWPRRDSFSLLAAPLWPRRFWAALPGRAFGRDASLSVWPLAFDAPGLPDGSPGWTALLLRQPRALASCSLISVDVFRSRRRARVGSPQGRVPRTTLNRHYLQFLWVFFLVAGAGVLADGIADVLALHAYERACFF